MRKFIHLNIVIKANEHVSDLITRKNLSVDKQISCPNLGSYLNMSTLDRVEVNLENLTLFRILTFERLGYTSEEIDLLEMLCLEYNNEFIMDLAKSGLNFDLLKYNKQSNRGIKQDENNE